MAPEKHDLAATRERLEFLLEKDGDNRQFSGGSHPHPGSTRQAFLAGAAFSGLVAGSILLTTFIDGKLHEPGSEPSAPSGTYEPLNTPPGIESIATIVDPRQAEDFSTGRPFTRTRVSPGVIQPSALVNTPNSVSPFAQSQTPIHAAPLAPVAGLSTSRSVITGVVDPRTMTASYYWTFTLKNTNKSSKEAQMNIALPAGAVVSRATLWINGRAEEAAFNTTSQVQNAYDWIVTRNRDPLLITQTEDGNINLKASPVMPKKEMKIRIGITTPMQMTADGKSQLELPHIIDANLDFNCVQNVHITSEAPLVSNDTRMNSPVQKNGFLLRGNVNAGDLHKLQISAHRDPNMTKFATRATHSNPPSYIVAQVQQDNQGLRSLNLTKSITQPDCPILKDEHAAFRMSYLWVKKEIERLAGAQQISQAEELATVYRVVSPVSGAVVLERQSDYDYNGLDRNLYKSLAYEPTKNSDDISSQGYTSIESSKQPVAELQRIAPAAAAPSAVPAPSTRASMDKVGGGGGNLMYDARPRRKAVHDSESVGSNSFKFANKIAMPVETKARRQKENVASSASHNNSTANVSLPTEIVSDPKVDAPSRAQLPAQKAGAYEQSVRLAGPVGAKLEALAKDANNLFLSKPITTAVLISLLGLTFSGGFILYALAALRLYRHQKGAIKLAGCGAIWFALAALAPLFSQVFTVLLATGLTLKAVLKALKPTQC